MEALEDRLSLALLQPAPLVALDPNASPAASILSQPLTNEFTFDTSELAPAPTTPVAAGVDPYGQALPRSIRSWTLTTLREKLIKIGAKVVSHSKYVILQPAEMTVPRQLFAALLAWIGQLRMECASG